MRHEFPAPDIEQMLEETERRLSGAAGRNTVIFVDATIPMYLVG
ncbi:hypothetical protein I546_3614 [Mycobacterium kansasii 732]|uniref:Uncharacterized protein n=1 Tax=Mycobacterium pseudokansasii TaxID=2341080 RepID=A0A498QWU5_9MYCO|nr:hypothetical protein [Mycobacterium pseudokansasii]EUA10528.1 hypothetical protein I546_3614 [Mycobacterium kansasii 732]VAZ97153.1 hypothetical protein LAUMK35_03568 [Mycobacterium pseudokansasii]VAZ98534.1 hypothetical protein LAUMK21_03565 [Mycobacterium pseudokansasii]VBA52239.1 hypothetical protein LAUMK142_03457 [Mycobacterium pseudokansasii]